MMSQLFTKIMGFIVIIITLALAPTINTSNATIEADNLTNLTGMTAVSAFGAPLIILGLLVVGGIFAIAGNRGSLAGATPRDLLGVIASVILIIVMLALFESVIDYTNTLIAPDASGFGDVIYGVIPLVIYVSIIGHAGWQTARVIYKGRKGRRAVASNF